LFPHFFSPCIFSSPPLSPIHPIIPSPLTTNASLHKVLLNTKYYSVCPPVPSPELGPFPANEGAPPPKPKGGRAHSPAI
jgi:hypothetical protein